MFWKAENWRQMMLMCLSFLITWSMIGCLPELSGDLNGCNEQYDSAFQFWVQQTFHMWTLVFLRRFPPILKHISMEILPPHFSYYFSLFPNFVHTWCNQHFFVSFCFIYLCLYIFCPQLSPAHNPWPTLLTVLVFVLVLIQPSVTPTASARSRFGTRSRSHDDPAADLASSTGGGVVGGGGVMGAASKASTPCPLQKPVVYRRSPSASPPSSPCPSLHLHSPRRLAPPPPVPKDPPEAVNVYTRCDSSDSLSATESSALLRDEEKSNSLSSLCLYYADEDIPNGSKVWTLWQLL
jgi:hypothetical protein